MPENRLKKCPIDAHGILLYDEITPPVLTRAGREATPINGSGFCFFSGVRR
jgi:hypothetical protein